MKTLVQRQLIAALRTTPRVAFARRYVVGLLTNMMLLLMPALGGELKSVSGKAIAFDSKYLRLEIKDDTGQSREFLLDETTPGISHIRIDSAITVFFDSDSNSVTRILVKSPNPAKSPNPKTVTHSTLSLDAAQKAYNEAKISANKADEERRSGKPVFQIEEVPSGEELRHELEQSMRDALKKAGLPSGSGNVPRGSRVQPTLPSSRGSFGGGGIDNDLLDKVPPFKVRRLTEFGKSYVDILDSFEQARLSYWEARSASVSANDAATGGSRSSKVAIGIQWKDLQSALNLPSDEAEASETLLAGASGISVQASGTKEALDLIVITIDLAQYDPDVLPTLLDSMLIDYRSRISIGELSSVPDGPQNRIDRNESSNEVGILPCKTIATNRQLKESLEDRVRCLFRPGTLPIPDPMAVSRDYQSYTFIELTALGNVLWRVTQDDEQRPKQLVLVISSHRRPQVARGETNHPVRWVRWVERSDGAVIHCGEADKDQQKPPSKKSASAKSVVSQIRKVAPGDSVTAIALYCYGIARDEFRDDEQVNRTDLATISEALDLPTVVGLRGLFRMGKTPIDGDDPEKTGVDGE